MWFLYKFNEGYLMTNLAIELLLLIVVLVNFGAILTVKIYLQLVKKKFNARDYFVVTL